MSSKFKARINNEKNFHNIRFSNNQKIPKVYKYGLYNWYKDYCNLITKTRGNTLEIGSGLESCFLNDDNLKNKIMNADIRVFSIDISEIAVKNCQELAFPGLKFIVEDAHELKNIEVKKIDNVLGRGIIHHLDINLFLNNLTKKTGKKFYYVFAEPMKGPFYLRLYRFFTPNIRTKDEHPLTINDLDKFRFSGIQKRKYYGFITLFFSFFGIRNKYLENIDDLLLNKLKLGRFLAWAVIFHNLS